MNCILLFLICSIFIVLQMTLLQTFESYLGEQWTVDVKQAWIDAYAVMTDLMLEGTDHTTEEVSLPSSGRGQKNLYLNLKIVVF